MGGTPWFDLFKQFLRHRDQTELEHGLGFCVLAGKARALQEKSGVAATQKTKEELREELAERLPQLGLKSSETEVTSAVDDVWSARNDPKLWKSLDSAFKTFVANKPSPSVSQETWTAKCIYHKQRHAVAK